MPSTRSNLNPKSDQAAGPQLRFEAIGTMWQIDFDNSLSLSQAAAVEPLILARIDQFDQHYSRFRDDSLVTAMAATSGRYRLPADAEIMLDLYRKLYELTGGAVTPLIGQVLSDAGYDAQYSLEPKTMHTPPRWEEILLYQFPDLTLFKPAILDFGALGKGYLIDIIANLLQQRGILYFCVDAGGDLMYRGRPGASLRVGLEDPGDVSKVIGVAQIDKQSLCGAAGNRRAWAGYTHIIDPRTLKSPEHIKALWVVAQTTMLADALTTALYFVSADILQHTYKFEYAILYSDHSLKYSPDFPAKFFSV